MIGLNKIKNIYEDRTFLEKCTESYFNFPLRISNERISKYECYSIHGMNEWIMESAFSFNKTNKSSNTRKFYELELFFADYLSEYYSSTIMKSSTQNKLWFGLKVFDDISYCNCWIWHGSSLKFKLYIKLVSLSANTNILWRGSSLTNFFDSLFFIFCLPLFSSIFLLYICSYIFLM